MEILLVLPEIGVDGGDLRLERKSWGEENNPVRAGLEGVLSSIRRIGGDKSVNGWRT